MVDNPFDPQDPSTTPQPGNPEIGKQWNDFLNDPRGSAALMQMGISLLQPIGVGQTALGAFGQAVGSAGEAIGRQEKEDQTNKLLNLRMGGVAERANNAAERLGIARERLNLSKEQADARMGLQANNAANKDIVAKRTFMARLAQQKSQDFMNTKYMGKGVDEILNDPAFQQEAERAWLALPQTNSASAAPARQSLQAGQVYDTPKGRLKWTGTGFVKP